MNDDITRDMVNMAALWKRFARRLFRRLKQAKMNNVYLKAENKRLQGCVERLMLLVTYQDKEDAERVNGA